MPARNVIKKYYDNAYYHVYNRGVEKRIIFLEDNDYVVFLNLLKRHLSAEAHLDNRGNAYESYAGRIELLAFCLMPNHFHLLFYLDNDSAAITELMRKVSGSYTTYFNKKYERVGHLFQGVYKASHVYSDSYLQHISRYIHLNPSDYQSWKYSSWPYYIKDWNADWVKPQRILDMFETDNYADFVANWIEQKVILEELKHFLADT